MTKALLISTSAAVLGTKDTGVWLDELAVPYYRFKKEGYEVTIASVAGGPIPIDPSSMGEAYFAPEAKRFMHDAAAIREIFTSIKVDSKMASEYDVVYVAGGHGCCADMEGEAYGPLKALLEAAYTSGKIVAACCHGPYALMGLEAPDGSPLTRDKKVTAFCNEEEKQAGAYDWVVNAGAKLMEDVFVAAGADYQTGAPWTSHVVVDGNLITGQNPQSSEACAEAVVVALSA